MVVAETHWGNRTSWILPSSRLEPGNVELDSLPKTDGKSGTEHGQKGTVDQSDFAGTHRVIGAASKMLDVQEIAIHLLALVHFVAAALHWTDDTCALLGSSRAKSTAT